MSRSGKTFSPYARLVLMNLLERLGQNSRAWPAQTLIASDVGCSPRQVINALDELKAAGFVVARRRGQGRTNDYTLDLNAILEWAETRKISTSSGAESAFLDPQNLHARSAKSALLEVQNLHPTGSLIDEDPQDEDPPRKIHQQKEAAAAASHAWLVENFRRSGITMTPSVLDNALDMDVAEDVWLEALRESALAGNPKPSYLFAIVRRINTDPAANDLEERKRRFLGGDLGHVVRFQ